MKNETDEETIARLSKFPNWHDFITALREGGVSDNEIAGELRRHELENAEISAGRCPDCGAALNSEVASKQSGPPHPFFSREGKWVSYWCSRDPRPGVYREHSACGFREDRYEPAKN